MKAQFEKEFNKLSKMGEKTFVLKGSNMVIEILPREELKSRGGIVLATPGDHVSGRSMEANRVEVCKVLMTGQGYWTEDGKYDALDIKPGAIVVAPVDSIRLISNFPGITRVSEAKLGLLKEAEVTCYYTSQEAYETAKAELNG